MEKVFVDDVLARYPQASYLSRGGQKVVFSLTHHSYGEVVLKVGLYTSQSIRERIEREVKTLRSIKSDYFPICHEFELLENNRFLIIEERAKGEPLTQHLRDFSDHQSALLILNHLVNGLSQLWSNNIIHRDVKPDNIIICQDTSLRIIDLGIARLLDEDSLTQTFAPFGPCTPNYASPEQLQNKKSEINHRSDQFSVGIVFGQLLLGGVHPFDPAIVGGQSMPENIIHNRWARVLLHERGHAKVLPLIEKLLAPQPYKRFRRPMDLNAEILRFQGEIQK